MLCFLGAFANEVIQIALIDCDLPPEDTLLSRLLETGATENSSASTLMNPSEEERKINGEMAEKLEIILRNIIASFDDLNNLKSILYAASLKTLSSNGKTILLFCMMLQFVNEVHQVLLQFLFYGFLLSQCCYALAYVSVLVTYLPFGTPL